MIFYGRNVVLEALSSEFRVNTLYLQEGINTDEKISKIIATAKQDSIKITYLNHKELKKILKTDDHQGVGIEIDFHYSKFSDIDFDDLASKALIYISDVTYEHNIGAIIRSAECAGLNGVILPKQINITPTVAKTSAGSIFHIPVFQESIFNAIKKFKDNSFFIFGIERDGKNYFDVDLTSPSLFIIGGEDKSLSEGIREKCDEVLEIPQKGKVNSLNMSVASSIILFERVKQLIKS